MASLTIRKLDDALKTRLRIRAAERGRSMEEEARRILCDALDQDPPRSLADLALAVFGSKHGIDLPPHPPVRPSKAPRFSRE